MAAFAEWLTKTKEFLFVESTPHLSSVPESRCCGERPGVTIVAIDTSPSMKETDYPPSRHEAAKRAYHCFIDKVREVEPERWVGLLEFNSYARVILSPRPVGEACGRLKTAAEKLFPHGSGTNIGACLLRAVGELNRIHRATQRTIILLTDGESTQGPNPVEMAGVLRGQGIQLDIIGIGGSPAEVNEADLKRMASRINGELRYWFIKSMPDLIRKFEALGLREVI